MPYIHYTVVLAGEHLQPLLLVHFRGYIGRPALTDRFGLSPDGSLWTGAMGAQVRRVANQRYTRERRKASGK